MNFLREILFKVLLSKYWILKINITINNNSSFSFCTFNIVCKKVRSNYEYFN